jgi:hypothetical protein
MFLCASYGIIIGLSLPNSMAFICTIHTEQCVRTEIYIYIYIYIYIHHNDVANGQIESEGIHGLLQNK